MLQSLIPGFCLFSHAVVSYIFEYDCHREMSLIGSTSFGYAQNTMHDFQNTILNSRVLPRNF